MTALPPPQPRPTMLPPVLPRQQVLAPLPARIHWYSGYKTWHWAVLGVGIALLAVVFGPMYVAILQLFN